GPAADAHVQRLRRSGGSSLLRPGPEEELLTRATMKDTRFVKLLVFVNCAVPLGVLGWDAAFRRLGANPVNYAIRTAGPLALIFLLLSLAITPVSRLTRQYWLVSVRRTLGLYAFFHALLHFSLFFGLDRGLSVTGTVSEVVRRPYLGIGMIGLALMVPLA